MLVGIPTFDQMVLSISSDKKVRIKGYGGEKGSIDVAEKLFNVLAQTKLQIDNDRTPDYFKWAFHLDGIYMPSKHFTYEAVTFQQKEVQKDSQYYYKPKLICLLVFI
ncbi:hypothetical protein [Bacillus sp. V5-8f]|uniref:hypothetical protein n=1 Tax=Bacillus sp. V5-8f TaxID=2053044 RepID=UPI000C76A0AC|nr:hypothetical protein [Bacillus sp. V5-8f]PLT32099.1 hypothetical protein CUU64_21275 [Bacillus sp. V5-8f]